jgi:hypothetical protein
MPGGVSNLPLPVVAHTHLSSHHTVAEFAIHRPSSDATPAAHNTSLSGGHIAAGESHDAPIRPFRLPPSRHAKGGLPPSEIEADGTGATDSPIAYFTGSGIDASDDLWYFNGATPQYYHTQITLTLEFPPQDGGQITWALLSGGNVVQLSGSGNTATLTSIGASDPTQGQGVSIEVDDNGAYYASANLAVPKPDHLVPIGTTDVADPTFGYLSGLKYRIEDQFNNVLPREVEVNEQWTENFWVNDWVGSNWSRYDFKGSLVDPAGFHDKIGGEVVGKTPAPQAPQTPLGNTKVQHWGQAFYVGGIDAGVGVKVQTDTLQKYQDHARHENIVSPPTS